MRQLPADTVRLLSSSQIVTCVSNVVKELVENSLDAGASSIEVKLENFGLDRLEVRDNGSGIKAVDAPVMALKHYTSKICCHDDLERLETYGFRGEALGSICAVAEVTVTTKTVSDKFSTQYTLNHTGHITSQKPSHLGQGTTVCVLKLFKNLPVRRQLYSNNKKCKEELKKAQDLLMAYGIIKPELRILLTHNKAAVWQKAKVPDHRTALMAVLGTAPMANMVPLQHHQEEPEVTIEGYFPKRGSDYSLTSSSNCDRTFIFINDRPVRHKEILKVLRQQYSSQVERDVSQSRYPILMMSITVPAASVDVNVTPDKTHVMLHNKDAVLLVVETMLVSLYGPESRTEPAFHSGAVAVVPDPSNCGSVLDDAGTGLDPPRCHTASLSRSSSSNHTAQPLQSRSADTSSSSISEDWVVDSIPRIPDLNLSLTDDDSILDALGTADFGPAEDGESPANAGRTGGVDTPEISAESWSRGHGLLDPDSREPLVPVKVCVPGATETEGTECEKRERMSSGVGDKASKLTAYDLISSCAVRRPLSASAIFEQEARAAVLRENPTASPRDIAAALEERWKNLGAEGRKKYEEKAEKELNRYNLQSKKVSERVTPAGESEKQPKLPLLSSGSLLAQKRKASFSQQQLDQLFSQPPKKKKTLPKNQSTLVPFSLEALRRRLTTRPVPCSTLGGLEIVGRLSSHGAWLVLRSHTLMLLNPSLLEEALLFNRLLETNVLPAASLCTPVQLTEGLLGGPENTRVLCDMQKETADLSGATYFSDPRLVANGFRIRLTPGSPSTESHLEVVGMADCVPFFGVADLREILTAIVKRNAATVKDCRPLKVHSFLEGEAVRLARQLPLRLSREDVRDMLSRKERQLSARDETCLHGRPFLHPLADVPETEQDAVRIAAATTCWST
uniref:PMS1 homolog 1, mismatch repair system component n=1 Tax=Scleropages formosus TaxID=113540 RepID=A0A8C9VG86_SCLFO